MTIYLSEIQFHKISASPDDSSRNRFAWDAEQKWLLLVVVCWTWYVPLCCRERFDDLDSTRRSVCVKRNCMRAFLWCSNLLLVSSESAVSCCCYWYWISDDAAAAASVVRRFANWFRASGEFTSESMSSSYILLKSHDWLIQRGAMYHDRTGAREDVKWAVSSDTLAIHQTSDFTFNRARWSHPSLPEAHRYRLLGKLKDNLKFSRALETHSRWFHSTLW